VTLQKHCAGALASSAKLRPSRAAWSFRETVFGGTRIVGMLVSEQAPRISSRKRLRLILNGWARKPINLATIIWRNQYAGHGRCSRE
jgi:hypothetical protein